jgi:hypothetical protein
MRQNVHGRGAERSSQSARADAGRAPPALLRTVTRPGDRAPRTWTGSWTDAPDNPSAVSAISAITRVIGAARAHGAWGRSSHNPPVVGSSPTRPPPSLSCDDTLLSAPCDPAADTLSGPTDAEHTHTVVIAPSAAAMKAAITDIRREPRARHAAVRAWVPLRTRQVTSLSPATAISPPPRLRRLISSAQPPHRHDLPVQRSGRLSLAGPAAVRLRVRSGRWPSPAGAISRRRQAS